MKKHWLLVMTCLVGSSAMAAKPVLNDPCFQSVFDKTLSGYHWRVYECVPSDSSADPSTYYKTRLSTPQGPKIDSPVFTAQPQLETQYKLVKPDVLLLDFIDERNGEALLLRPLIKTPNLSIARFRYLTGDEESLIVRQDNAFLTFLPAKNRMRIELKPDGHLSLIR
ncbi:hypothetical protein LIN78_10185 [Leeia sp. TBRC 13508]|uniref:Uncharacterized protein n=1 Tax=Leeia speluncae TaxID=2884804 RepID=A0ABS8D7F2_9NEIS|nr:hypothetical protein [Leeia speluncae]MCB6183911.1 hypothetical protein [Leeia speluncae]